MLPSMLKLFSEIAINGIFPIPPGSIMRRSPSKAEDQGPQLGSSAFWTPPRQK